MARRKGRGLREGGRLSHAPFLGAASSVVLSVSGDAGGSSSGKGRRSPGQVGDAGSGVACCPRSSSPQRLQQRHSVRAEVRRSPTFARLGLLLRTACLPRPEPARLPVAATTTSSISDGFRRMWLLAVTTTFWGLLLAPGKRAKGRAGPSRHLGCLWLRLPRGESARYLAKFARSPSSCHRTTTAALPQPHGSSLTRLLV